MTEVSGDLVFNDVDIFKIAIEDDNVEIQLETIQRLPFLAIAIDFERTRDELLPYFLARLDDLSEELKFHLSAQLEDFVPFVGGSEHAFAVLQVLAKLCAEDEVVVRERAIEAMKNIAEGLTEVQCETFFIPIIEDLLQSDWFTSKCSASAVIAMCYAKITPERRPELRNIFRGLIQDDSPLVRRFAEIHLIQLINTMDPEEIKAEFVPVFDNLTKDDQDSVRVLAVDVAIAVAKKLKEFEVYEYVLKTFINLADDSSWRVRQRIALRIHEILRLNHEEGLSMYVKCTQDEEEEVRIVAASNLVNVVDSLRLDGNIEELFQDRIMPAIRSMSTDCKDVRLTVSNDILSLSTILPGPCFSNNIVPLVLEILEQEDSVMFQENILKNLNALPMDIDITEFLKPIKNFIKKFLDSSKLKWRTRRNLLMLFLRIAQTKNHEYFDKNLKIFYLNLLNDSIFAIRRTAPLILPVLSKNLGMNWAKDSLIPIFTFFSKDHRYSYRLVTLFGINELIEPTLEPRQGKYLDDLKQLINKSGVNISKHAVTLARIQQLNSQLQESLDIEAFTAVLCAPEDVNTYQDDIKLYAEDILDNLKQFKKPIFAIDETEEITYIEGVLIVLIKDFLDLIKVFFSDNTENVRGRARATLRKIEKFSKEIAAELEEEWVPEALKLLSAEEVEAVAEGLKVELTRTIPGMEEETIDPSLMEEIGTLCKKEALPDLRSEVEDFVGEINNNEEKVPCGNIIEVEEQGDGEEDKKMEVEP